VTSEQARVAEPIDRDRCDDPSADGDSRPQPQPRASFDGLETMKGGEFFFAPSIPFLRYLA